MILNSKPRKCFTGAVYKTKHRPHNENGRAALVLEYFQYNPTNSLNNAARYLNKKDLLSGKL